MNYVSPPKNELSQVLTLTRVMTSGVIMSIERNERELAELIKYLRTTRGKKHVSLVNSRTAALHQALLNICASTDDRTVNISTLRDGDLDYCKWLRLDPTNVESDVDADVLVVDADILTHCKQRVKDFTGPVVLDLTCLGFGPAAALLTDDESVYDNAERLKIFGSWDMRTMWTQEESAPEVVGGVQFNYRLSPLVAACIRTHLKEFEV